MNVFYMFSWALINPGSPLWKCSSKIDGTMHMDTLIALHSIAFAIDIIDVVVVVYKYTLHPTI